MPQGKLSVLVYAPASVPMYRDFPEEVFRQRQAELGVRIDLVRRYDEVRARIAEPDVYFGARLDAEDFRQAKHLRWVHVPLAGIDRVLTPDLAASDCLLTNSRGCMAAAVAEHALGAILHFARGFDLAVAGQRARRWENVRELRMPMELADLSVGLVGFGEIGRELASRCKALGMKVFAMRRRKGANTAPDLVDRMWGPGHLEDLIDASIFVVLAAPALPDTEKLIGRRELMRMGPQRFLINVARGPLVDEEAVYRALREKWIGGAALDVFEKEPLPAESPLWALPNLLLTPHIAGQTPHFWERVVALFFRNLERFGRGEPLEKLVDKGQGY
ncbi:D-2-hydroxyacid dehydrogenase [Limnochorda pilosa]|uniref:D-isomer specific 2-hydroxyacid dehydrogenase n=1 Tax=Limnochorda pilosa TaxID=1555112 RepID=A0A0K2SP95_LIMPI|nr:D-2-hydroxyacid dehydrogenase [Limnochorda pilosa]BAS28817.1 D-isomer specific 2-hydroxyacid dehydrogenase [Limnochorda pilosa]